MNLNILNLKIITFDKLMTTYSITRTNKLIDLNGDKTNFVCSFECRSVNGDDFYTAVVDQTTLDNEEDGIPYKKSTNGVVTNTFTSENNIYQNHFLVLKSDDPCEVVVNINLKELPKKLPSEEEIRKLEMIKQQLDEEYQPPQPTFEEKRTYNWTRIFLICLVIIGILSVIYYFYNKKQTKTESETYNDLDKNVDEVLKLLTPVDVDPPIINTERVISPSPVKRSSPSPVVIESRPHSPIGSPTSPVFSTNNSPENDISKKIHEKLMEKLKRASIAY